MASEYKVKVNGGKELSVVLEGPSSGALDGKAISWDQIKVKDGSFHILKDNRSYNVEVIKAEPETKTFVISVNGNKYTLNVKDKYDELLHNLGLDNLNSHKVNELKAPMPGLVLNIVVEEGTEVKKGSPLLVLEAMKMENILKAPADVTVKKIAVKKGMAVEKNQVLIFFA